MDKEQSADDPTSVDLIRVKICLIAPFLQVPDVVIACIERKIVSGSIQSN